MIIVAVDPGDTTGYIVAEVQISPQSKSIAFQKAGHWTDLASYIDIQSWLTGTSQIVIEDYRIYPHRARQHIGKRPYAIEVIGHIRLLAHTHSIPTHFQSASQAKQQWPNSRLARHYPTSHLRQLTTAHTKDALRHLLTYIENQTSYGRIFSKGGAI